MMHVIFLAPHFPANQRRFVRGLKAVGARVTGIGDAPVERLDNELRGLLDAYEYVPSVTNAGAVFDAVRRVQRRGPWVHKLEAVVEAHMLCAAKVREATGIPGLSLASVNLCRDKAVMKEHLRAQGLPCARSAPVSSSEEGLAFARAVGFPLIVKPRDGAGAAGTSRVDDEASLLRALAAGGVDGGRSLLLEEFVTGHEGFYDTLTVSGRVVFDGISHYYPNVLEGMRDRGAHPMIVTTNRVNAPGYAQVRELGRKVNAAMGISTSATHMEWFYGDKGLYFSEIGARPPGCNFWDLYCAANDMDLYTEWARAVVWGDTWSSPTRRFAGGLVAIRPNRDGIVQGYAGAEEIERKYAPYILRKWLPPVGSRTQPVEAGFLANAWYYVRHPDYDAARAILDDIGGSLRMIAR